MGSLLVLAGLLPSRRLIEYNWVEDEMTWSRPGSVIEDNQGRAAGTYGI
jgi:hypothetical protein